MPARFIRRGSSARGAVDHARESVAALIGAKPAEIVFTSGGTEADNLAIFGVAAASTRTRKHVVTTAIEHHAVLNTCQELERQGIDVTYVPVGSRWRRGSCKRSAARCGRKPC